MAEAFWILIVIAAIFACFKFYYIAIPVLLIVFWGPLSSWTVGSGADEMSVISIVFAAFGIILLCTITWYIVISPFLLIGWMWKKFTTRLDEMFPRY